MIKKPLIKTIFANERIITAATEEARELYNSNRFGSLINDKVQLSLLEALYLLEKGKIEVFDGRNKILDFEAFVSRARRLDKSFWNRFVVFKDLRDRGYIVKTALKFGADFRVYDRGVKPGEEHAKWVVYAVHESETSTWHSFSAKNRVAHSTKKRLMIGTVDDEGDVTYWEVKWIKP
ncbi:tRNA-intron lyase [Candidatus Woesearchaeota archaeon]|nr:tRNA-intron lyase [Candidatus Woesearchaeota archaeon]